MKKQISPPDERETYMTTIPPETLAELDRLEKQIHAKEKQIKIHCADWADDDTRVKAICARHGIESQRDGDFKTHVECVDELSEQLEAARKAIAAKDDIIRELLSCSEDNKNWSVGKRAEEVLSPDAGADYVHKSELEEQKRIYAERMETTERELEACRNRVKQLENACRIALWIRDKSRPGINPK
jgi:hypothetical protein